MVWSITLNAPLEEPANPNHTMNPSKAPWYFVGLQEMLVYFDPWFAGVVLPTLIVVGLMVFPYVDTNPLGVGYYTIRQRAVALLVLRYRLLRVATADLYRHLRAGTRLDVVLARPDLGPYARHLRGKSELLGPGREFSTRGARRLSGIIALGLFFAVIRMGHSQAGHSDAARPEAV